MSEPGTSEASDLAARASRYGTASCRPTVEALQAYEEKLAAMDDEKLERETCSIILTSARFNNQPKAVWHWQADACYAVCESRKDGDPYLYRRAHDSAVSSQGHHVSNPAPARPAKSKAPAP